MAEKSSEQKKFRIWILWTFIWALIVPYLLMLLMLPLESWVREGLDVVNFNYSITWWKSVIPNPGKLSASYGRWWVEFWRASFRPASFYLPFIPFISFFLILFVGILNNPHRNISDVFGSGRLATKADIKEIGLFDGFIMVLGRFKGKYLRMKETLSALVVAPPGTGKTAAVVVPTILETDGVSLIINDPKPELCYNTSGYRATQGPVFVINWGMDDDPSKGIYYPSWNPLSPNSLPPLGSARDLYIDSMVNVFVEENPKDPHWSTTGRAALAGFIHFIASKAERARANDYFVNKLSEGSFDAEDAEVLETYYMDMADVNARSALQALKRNELTLENYVHVGTWAGLPDMWHGGEPCIAMIMDWLTDAQMRIMADLKRRTEEGDQSAMYADPMRDLLDSAVQECSHYGYARRATIELNQLAGVPDKERGSTISTALAGVAIFKNAAVRTRTKFSDISFRDLRGMADPITGELKPISVYLSVNLVDARALNVITGVFIELMSSYLISNPPMHVGADGVKAGPFPVLFVLDEFPQMPKLSAVMSGPAVGRGQKVSYLMIGQDLGQISGKYGKDDLETIITTTAAKVILAQNNEQTAKRFSEMIGNKTIEVANSKSKEEGLSSKSAAFASNVTRSLQSSNVVGVSDMMSLAADKQYVLFQGFLNRPILADSPRYYLDKKMLKKTQMPAAPAVPYWIVAQRENSELETLKAEVKEDLYQLEQGFSDLPTLSQPQDEG